MSADELRTRRQWLMLEVVARSEGPMPAFLVTEAISSTAIEHPEWDMDELMTRAEWEAR